MQLSTLRTEVRQKAGYDANDAMVADAVITSFINSALRQVAAYADWDWNYDFETITSVVGQAAYSREASCRKTDMVVDVADGGLLQQINRRQAARYATGSAVRSNSIPRFWYVLKGQLYLVPTPQEARSYNHVFVGAEPTLSADSDEPEIPDWAIDLVIIKAAIMVAARTDNTSQLQLLEREERDLLDVMADEARRARGPQIPESRRDWRI